MCDFIQGINLGLNLPMCKMRPVGLCLTKNKKGLSNLNLGGSGILAPGFDNGMRACLGLNSSGSEDMAGSSKSDTANKLSRDSGKIPSALFSLLKTAVAG